MAAAPWSASHPLVRRILRETRDFEYFQLLHLVERTGDNIPIGHQGPAAREPVRLRPTLSLAFPACDLDFVDWDESDQRLRVTTTFLGMYGSDSPLPTHFTEALLAETEDDERVRAFLDLFHHRIFSLLYRSWAKYRYHIAFRTGGTDAISQVVRAFLGIGTPGTAEHLRTPPVRLFRYAGLLSQRPRSASGLAGLLRDFFDDVDFDVEQCVGRWLPIQPDDRNKMGQAKCALGTDFLLGERIFDRSGKFRVRVGPVDFATYTRFLPGEKAARQLAELVTYFSTDPLQFDTEVILKSEEVPDLPLGERGFLGRLSRTSWLKSRPSGDKPAVFPASTF